MDGCEAAAHAKMIRIGADALAQAKGGQVRLRYLYRTIQP